MYLKSSIFARFYRSLQMITSWVIKVRFVQKRLPQSVMKHQNVIVIIGKKGTLLIFIPFIIFYLFQLKILILFPSIFTFSPFFLAPFSPVGQQKLHGEKCLKCLGALYHPASPPPVCYATGQIVNVCEVWRHKQFALWHFKEMYEYCSWHRHYLHWDIYIFVTPVSVSVQPEKIYYCPHNTIIKQVQQFKHARKK